MDIQIDTYEQRFLNGDMSGDLFSTLEGNCIADSIRNKNFERFEELCSKCKLNDQRNNHGDTLLIVAISKDDSFFLRELLEKGINVNSVDKESSTALHYAAANGCTESVKILIEFWADPEIIDTYCDHAYTAYDYVKKSNGCKQIKILLEEYQNNIDELSIKGSVDE